MRRGAVGWCRAYGHGKLFDGSLKLNPSCFRCGDPLNEYRTADAPAVLTISIIGVLFVPLLWVSFAVFRPEPIVLLS